MTVVEFCWKHKKELPDAALISIGRVSLEVVRDDKCEALGGPQKRTAGSWIADNTQQGALLTSVRCY